MQIFDQLGQSSTIVLLLFILVVLAVFAIHYYKYFRIRKRLKSVTPLKRGTRSERALISSLVNSGIPAVTLFHDLCIEKTNAKFSQVDLVMATTEAIIVFEEKDYSGWIYGDGGNTTWTKVLNYGKGKYHFYNPIKQNNSHIKAIRKLHLQFKYILFYSVIVCIGDCELKEINYVPKNVYLVKANRVFEVLREIKANNQPARYKDKREVVRVLQEAVNSGANASNQAKHIANIKEEVGKGRIFEQWVQACVFDRNAEKVNSKLKL